MLLAILVFNPYFILLSPIPGLSLSQYPKPALRACVPDSATPWTVAHQSPLSMEFSRPRILEWVSISFSKDRTCVSCISCIGRQFLYHCATCEALQASCALSENTFTDMRKPLRCGPTQLFCLCSPRKPSLCLKKRNGHTLG